MLAQYGKFFLNGGILGIVAWGLQMGLYRMLGGGLGMYPLATAITYVPLVVINFLVQRHFIFNRHGLFGRFVFANLLVMGLVSLLSWISKIVLDIWFGAGWGDNLGFAIAAMLGSVPSFMIKKYWVFNAETAH